MKHGRLAVRKLLLLLKTDTENQVAVIEALAALADDSTEEVVADAIYRLRYHKDKQVRRAVEVALNKLQNRKNP
jgi:ABC-type uncharacterized transport system auxiliary subunit